MDTVTEKGARHTVFLSYLSRTYSSGETFEMERALADLDGHPGWIALQTLIGAAVEAKTSLLKNGKLLEQAEYARELGLLVGLESLVAAREAVSIRAGQVRKTLEQREPEPVGAGRE